MDFYHNRLSEKLAEALKAVLPIIGIVLVLSFSIAPIPPSILLLFLFGAVLLVIAMLRMLFSKALSTLLIVFYTSVFALSFFVPKDFLAVAFDSGGVTTGHALFNRPDSCGSRSGTCITSRRSWVCPCKYPQYSELRKDVEIFCEGACIHKGDHDFFTADHSILYCFPDFYTSA